MSRTSLMLFLPAPAITAAFLAACTNLAGVGGSATASCLQVQGRPCQSVRDAYEARGSAMRPVPAPLAPMPTSVNAANTDAATVPVLRERDALAVPARYETPAGRQGTARVRMVQPEGGLRSAPTVLRGWFKPWKDADGDLFEETYAYVTLNDGDWLIEHNRQRIREGFQPLRAPAVLPIAEPAVLAPAAPGTPAQPAADANGAAPQ
jgi:conjugal transfer pilus assembly protein TraV